MNDPLKTFYSFFQADAFFNLKFFRDRLQQQHSCGIFNFSKTYLKSNFAKSPLYWQQLTLNLYIPKNILDFLCINLFLSKSELRLFFRLIRRLFRYPSTVNNDEAIREPSFILSFSRHLKNVTVKKLDQLVSLLMSSKVFLSSGRYTTNEVFW